MNIVDQIPVERGTTMRGREIRCARWLYTALSRLNGRTRFVVIQSLPDGRRVALHAMTGLRVLEVPRVVYSSWRRRGWLHELGEQAGARCYDVSDSGAAAARAVEPQEEG
jgi:hypothetical protein